jgi:hypothetical protein|tara:strand:+ start:796 stop:1206 length:411 start_codon:yes stop_codon:yes gene_type:complete
VEQENNAIWSPAEMLEIILNEPDDFLKVRETLTRIGVASRKEQKLFQSCHILHKQGRYFIVHFKELFLLDGKKSNFEDNDALRRNTIATLLADWGLIRILNPELVAECAPLRQIKIISHKDKDQWELCPKYNIGNK